MKQLIRHISRVRGSARYSPLRPGWRSGWGSLPSVLSILADHFSARGAVPGGYLPVYVGDEMERFVVNAELLNHPIFVKLLNMSALEHGFQHKGALRIPCHVLVFERLLEGLRLGFDPDELQHLFDDLGLSKDLFD